MKIHEFKDFEYKWKFVFELPATKLRSRSPCFLSVMKTPAVSATAMLYTILVSEINSSLKLCVFSK